MSVDEAIRQAIQEDADHCPVRSVPWENIRDRAIDGTVSSSSRQSHVIIRNIGYALVAVVVIAGLSFASSFISPVMAGALQRIPAVQSAFDYFEETWGLQNAIDKGFATTVNRTATDKAITVTITNVSYDQGRLSIGYVVTTSRPDLYLKDVLPYDIPLPIPPGREGMQLFANGKAINNASYGSSQNIDNSNVGIRDVSTQDLPESFNLQILIHQIAGAQGKWLLTVPASRQQADKATKTFAPNKGWTVGQTTVVVKQVQICPTDIIVTYQMTHPVGDQSWDYGFYLPCRIFDDQGNGWGGPGCDSPVSDQVEGNTDVLVIQSQRAASLKSTPKYLIFTYFTQKIKGEEHRYLTGKTKIFLN